MKLFQQKTKIQKFDTAKEFVEEYGICESDFILASRSIYEAYFTPLNLKAHVAFKNSYGVGEPTDLMIDALMEDFAKTGCTRIIAIGGGAVIDMAKILVLDGQYKAEDIYLKKVPLKKARSLIAVPTTCGAGSEVSNVTIAELTNLHTKMGLAVDELYAEDAVLIPELLSKLPYDFFANSAIDAFIHAIESYMSPRATLYTQMCSMKAMEMILEGFKAIIEHGQEYRMNLLEEFLVASNLAGVAFGNAGTGIVHAMSYPLSGVYHVAHGEANYQFFTAGFAFYQEQNPEGAIRPLNEFLGKLLDCAAEDVYAVLETLLNKITFRKPLREYGMTEEDIITFAKSVEATQQRLLNQSYVKPNWEQMAEIYRKLY